MSRTAIIASSLCLALGALAGAAAALAPSADLQFAGRALILLGSLVLLLTLLGRRLVGQARTDHLLGNLALLAVSVAIATVAAEGLTRLAYHDVTTTGDNRSYFSQRWNRSVIRNAAGYRERELDPGAPRPACRIAVIGDSFTFGQGIEVKDRFTNRLEALLRDRGADVEVLNFGIPGAGTADHLRALQQDVLPLAPDFIVLQWFFDDVERPRHARLTHPAPLLPSDYLTAKLFRSSALFYVLTRHWEDLQYRHGWAPRLEQTIRSTFGDPSSPGSRRATAELESFLTLCEEHHAGVAVVLFPLLTPTNPYAYLHERVHETCRTHGTPYVDLAPSLVARPDPRTLWVNPLDGHAGPEANRIAAEQLFAKLGAWWMQACGTPPVRAGTRAATGAIGLEESDKGRASNRSRTAAADPRPRRPAAAGRRAQLSLPQ